MKRALRILHLEDDARDAELAAANLLAAGFTCEMVRVESRADFEAEVRAGGYDLILSDFTLPAYDGGTALAFARQERPEIPLILVSGTVGEDAAVRSLVGGATDYVLKDRLSRLAPAVQRALREAENWRARRRAEEALLASEQRYRRLFEASKDGILLLDAATGTILDANPALVALLGHSREDLLGRTVADVGIAREPASEAALRELASKESALHPDLRLTTAGGQVVDVDLVSSAYVVGALRVIQVSVRDVTERRHLEEQLRQSQKLEAVGRRAGGVAHDFNNLLVVINSYTELALDALGPDHPLRDDLEEVRRSGVRAAKLTGQLLAFSRRQILRPVVCSLNTVVLELEKMLNRVIGEDVAIHLRLASDLGNVLADPGQMEQVLINLVVNSRDAMEKGGTILVETANVEIGPEEARTRADVGPGSYVCMSVADTGCGMDEATRARMFEPFFTTKPQTKGTGLGLSMVYGIVKQSGGFFDVDSAPGKGTTIRACLPRHQGPVAVAPPPERTAPAPPRASETILVVEDDSSVRRLVQRVLVPLGYRVLTAASGAEAIAALDRHGGSVDLLLTDVVLAGMDGGDLARLLVAARPTLRVLYMSGYTAEAVLHHGPSDPGAVILQKPFTVADLVQRVRLALAP